MWIFIVIIAVIAAFIIFKVFDRDFIKITHQDGNRYLVEFESGKSPICELVEKTEYSDSVYYILIPIESLKSIPDEDIIILRSVRQTESKIICVFPDEEADKAIYTRIKEKYADKYNFAQ